MIQYNALVKYFSLQPHEKKLVSQPRKNPKIDILLPIKESFSAANAGAVATVVYDIVLASAQSARVTVIGGEVELPFPDINFSALKPKRKWLYGKNLGFAAAYLDRLMTHSKPDLIEVHGRCNVATFLLEKRPDIPVILFLHNDPRFMKGAKSVRERQLLLNNLVQIICVSDYVRKCFFDGLTIDGEQHKKVGVYSLGVNRKLKSPPLKEHLIFIAGRMIPEKGILEASSALAGLLPDYPEWRLVIAGARRFDGAAPDSYVAKVAKTIAPLGRQAEMTGFIPLDVVRKWQERAAIAACPSLWQEPLGKVVVESLAAGCAVLTTRCGGIPEVAEGRAMIIDNPSISTFRDGFETLLTNEALRRDLQARAWNDFPFTNMAMAHKVHLLRQNALSALNGHRRQKRLAIEL